MSKLKDETTRVTTAIKEIENELSKYNKGEIQHDINQRNKINNLLEDLMEDEDIQKKYPKYNKLKKLYYAFPSLTVTFLTILILLISVILKDITFTTFAPVLAFATDYVMYHGLTNICDKKIAENEEYKPYYDIYGDKPFSAKRALKDYRSNEKEIEKDKETLQTISSKETELSKLDTLLSRLNGIRDDFVEKALGDSYSSEITEVQTQFDQLGKKPIQKKM